MTLRLPVPADQVSLPVAGHGAVGDVGGPVADHDHELAEPGALGAYLAVAPDLPDALGRPDGAGGLGEVHAPAHQLEIFRVPRLLHVVQLVVLGSVELVHHVPAPSKTHGVMTSTRTCCSMGFFLKRHIFRSSFPIHEDSQSFPAGMCHIRAKSSPQIPVAIGIVAIAENRHLQHLPHMVCVLVWNQPVAGLDQSLDQSRIL